MRLLTFQAELFAYRSFSKTLPEVPDQDVDERVENAVVAFMHVEKADEPAERRRTVFKKTLKHLKWLANKRELRSIVLHSFTHLGADNADADFAQELLVELAERLRGTGYEVKLTPFGYFCSWQLSVFGDSLAKVYKEV